MKRKMRILSAVLVALFFLTACGGNDISEQTGAQEPAEEPSGYDSKIPDTTTDYITTETEEVATGEVLRYITNDEEQFARKTEVDALYVGTTIPISSIDPGNNGDSSVFFGVFDTMLKRNTQTGELEPNVLTKWEWQDDTTLYLEMRDDIVFHDGTPMTIEDVAYTLERNGDATRASRVASIFSAIDWEKSTIDGEYCMTLKLTEPSAVLVSYFANSECSVLSKAHMETMGDDAFFDNTIGSGAFKVESVVTGDRYNLVRNENYWGDSPAYDKLVIRYYAETTTMFIDYENGDLDMILCAAAEDAARVIDGSVPNTTLGIYPGVRMYSIEFNKNNQYLADEAVRQAICMAVDPAIVAEVGWSFLGGAGDSAFPSGTAYRLTNQYTYDPEAAHQILVDAGYKDGEIVLTFGTNNIQTNVNMVETIQAMLSEIGIVVEPKISDMSAFIVGMMGIGTGVAGFDMIINVQPTLTLDPATTLSIEYSQERGGYPFGFVNGELDELLVTGQTSLDEDVREQTYHEIQMFIFDGYWKLPLADMQIAIIARDYVQGISCIDPRMPYLNNITFAY